VKGNGITMTRRSRVPGFLPLLLVALVAACQPAAGSPPASAAASVTPQATATQTAAPAAFPLTVTDDAGREVTIAAEPQRVVSLAPSNTEIVCALDACERLVGVPDFRDGYPPEVLEAIADVPSVVTFGPVDREAIVAAEPDLVLAAGNELTPSDDIAALADLGLAVLVLYPESLDEVYADITLVGEALGAADEAEELVADMEARVADVEAAVAGAQRPRTFYEVSVFQGTIYTAGADSFLAALIELAGGEPVTGDAVTTAIQLEDLVAADPELILLGDAAYDDTITPESVGQRPGWEAMTAVVGGRVVPMPEDLVITRPGPRIVDGLEALARAIHPERLD
jgi:iron complex transport system substrate-binding protein